MIDGSVVCSALYCHTVSTANAWRISRVCFESVPFSQLYLNNYLYTGTQPCNNRITAQYQYPYHNSFLSASRWLLQQQFLSSKHLVIVATAPSSLLSLTLMHGAYSHLLHHHHQFQFFSQYFSLLIHQFLDAIILITHNFHLIGLSTSLATRLRIAIIISL